MKSFVFFIGTLLAVPVLSEPYQTASDYPPFVCTSGEAAFQAQKAKDVGYKLSESGVCRPITSKTKFKVLERTADKNQYFYRIQLLEEPQPEPELFISGFVNAPQDPEANLAARQAELNKLPIGCTLPTGGQMNRLERGKDGQVLMKKYMVRSECRDGKMVQTTTPIE